MPQWSGNPIATDVRAGDGFRRAGSSIGGFVGVAANWGQISSGKSTVDNWAYWRFEPDVPAGATINGVAFSLTSNNPGLGADQPWGVFGLADDSTALNWESAAGLAAGSTTTWPSPLTAANHFNGAILANGFQWQPSAYVAGDEIGWWEGTGVTAAATQIVGLVAEVQDWIDSRESLRGTGVGAGIPIMFMVAASASAISNYVTYWRSVEYATVDERPLLTIDYTPLPEEATISARTGSGQVVRARPRSALAAASRVGAAPQVSGRISTSQVVSGRTATAPVVRSRVRTL